ncbi:hypothetical protein BDD12DRAFT_863490, partial [Trichophaea hybrida]
GFVQFTRICSFTIWFLTCVLFIGAPLYFVHRRFYYAWMARTKQHFGVVVTTITQWWSPTVIRVTGDRTVRDQIKRTSDGGLECRFPDRLVLIANHQLYSDWLYLWWIAYTARMHGFVYIILKESLKWEQDKSRLLHRLSKLASGRDTPMWLLIFPEGTNLSINGRRTSTKYAEKLGMADVQHQLLPRSTGLRFCLEQMKGTVDWVYDCTVAYEGVPIYFTLYSTFFQGRPPKSVNMHWRRFAVKDIPLTDSDFPEDDDPKQNGTVSESPELRKRITIGKQERLLKSRAEPTNMGCGKVQLKQRSRLHGGQTKGGNDVMIYLLTFVYYFLQYCYVTHQHRISR